MLNSEGAELLVRSIYFCVPNRKRGGGGLPFSRMKSHAILIRFGSSAAVRIQAGLAEQLEGQLRGLVRLGQDGDTRLGQDLGPGHVRGFCRHIHIDDP